jgi:tetratricopeptide (TPR) repeat protein
MKKLLLVSLIGSALAATPVLSHETSTSEYGKLGKVSFANSCDPAIQEDLQRSVAMLHSFWFVAAEKSFAELMKRDPSCVIAHWGYASILMSNPLAGQGALPASAPKAQAAIDAARKTGAKTERERVYLEAVAAYYEDFANRPERARQLARAKAYEALAAKYPDDDEAQIFAALYTAGTQQQSDQTYAAYLKAAAALETQFKKYPDHPGVAHYLIHSYDAPPIAAKGLNAARLYATIAPDAPHALHMPSHIFTRVGSWEESAATNLRSAAVAKKSGESDEYCHAHDYAVYAYLQLGRDEEARRAMEEGLKVPTPTKLFVGPYALVAMPARYALERSDWKAAMNLPDPGTNYPQDNAQGHLRGPSVRSAAATPGQQRRTPRPSRKSRRSSPRRRTPIGRRRWKRSA